MRGKRKRGTIGLKESFSREKPENSNSEVCWATTRAIALFVTGDGSSETLVNSGNDRNSILLEP